MVSSPLRLLPPDDTTAARCPLDASQLAALDAARTADALLVVGASGTGKTTLVERIALAAINDWGLAPGRVLVLAATRAAAGQLRDQIGHASQATAATPLVRTAASLAVAILGARADAIGAGSPTFVTGPEQDRELAEIIAGRLADLPYSGEPAADLPPGWTPQVMALRGFRDELRDLLMRAAEWGLEPAELARLGEAQNRPEWVYAADIYAEYRAINRLRALTPGAGVRLDPGLVINEAARALANWSSQISGIPAPSFDLIIVDDYQEATFATASLLENLHRAGARIVLVGDPDSAVQTFRGASPMLIGRAAKRAGTEAGAVGAKTFVLSTNWRQPRELWDVTNRVLGQIPTVGGPIHRRVTTTAGSGESAVEFQTFSSTAQECAWIARKLRVAHHQHGISWDQMAVITRSGGQLARVRRELAVAGVPIAVPGSALPLQAEPAVQPLLALFRYCLRPDEITAPTIANLLTSPVGGLDPLSLRRLRRELRSSDPTKTSDELLLAALQPEALASEEQATGPMAQLASLVRILAAGREHAASAGVTAQTLLWTIWAATGLAERWRDVAIAGGVAGLRADHDLDMVVALFRAAEVYVERHPGAPPDAFLDFILAQELPADSLARSAYGAPSVAAVTPAIAAGREWDLVVVAGVQDGNWPNLRLRDSMFGAFALTEYLAGRSVAGKVDERAARKQILADELRTFAVAVSRARRELIVTAVSNTDQFPSDFCELVTGFRAVEPVETPERCDGIDTSLDFSTGTFDLSGVVAIARRALLAALKEPNVESSADKTARLAALRAAVVLLAELADRGVTAADPSNWYGAALPSSDKAIFATDDRVPVSPSQLESISKCPLRWAFETAGAKAAGEYQAQIGTLVHSIAEQRPNGTQAEYLADLDRRWSELELPDNWLAKQLRENAAGMIERLAIFVAQNPDPLAVEAGFTVRIGRAELRGKVDRIDAIRNPDGTVAAQITDFKTGKKMVTVEEAETNPQLTAYQLGIEESPDLQEKLRKIAGGPLASGGAQLIYLATGAKGPAPRSKKPLSDEVADNSVQSSRDWARELVETAAQTISGSRFLARENDGCRQCPVRSSCPLRAKATQ